ncbi:MAG TPA: type II secretion system protein [Fimbriimonadaceae bacterium]|nr:type II secretion system protein [Fimbriimonadaceae bacterium]
MPKRRHAFTLIELLVVVAIIALLAGILFPVFVRAKVAAKQTSCASNMRQIGLGITMYATDYDGFCPRTAHSDFGPVCWVFSLRPYVGRCDEIRICPADPKGTQRRTAQGTSYVLNDWIAVPPVIEEGEPLSRPAYNNLTLLPRPAETHLAFITSDKTGVNYQQDHTHSTSWFAVAGQEWAAITSDIQPDRHRLGRRPLNDLGPSSREGSANYLFADGHVKALSAARIYGFAKASHDFAKPPTDP